MTTFHAIVLKCPHCGTLMTGYDLMSYTVHRSTSWSDGKTESGAPDAKQISICAICRKAFWKDGAKLPDDPNWQPHDDLASVMDIWDLDWRFDDDAEEKTIAFYKELLDDGFADTDDRELFLRIRIWWSLNNLVRHLVTWRSARNLGMLTSIMNHRKKNLQLFTSYRELFEENLERLIFLYIKSADVDLLYLADMYREMGNFNKAREILKKAKRKTGTWRRMSWKVRRENRRVFEL